MLAIISEGGAGGNGVVPVWPQVLRWLGPTPFTSDALSWGLGAWVLLLGGLCLLKMALAGHDGTRAAIATFLLGATYALVHLTDLLVFAGVVLFVALMIWVYFLLSGEHDALTARSSFSLGLGAALLFAATLLVGRTTGGSYSLDGLSLSALTVWPLSLLALYAVAWLGMSPLIGWSAHLPTGALSTMLLSVVLPAPVVALILRLQALITDQAVGGTVPEQWPGFTNALAWAGAATALVASAGTVVWVGRSRWPALQAAFWLGMGLWALGLDTPSGRVASLLIIMSYGASRTALELLPSSTGTLWVRSARGLAHASLSALPPLSGFLGVWVLGGALASSGRPSLVMLLAACVVLAACGTALDAATHPTPSATALPAARYLEWVGGGLVVLLVVAGPLAPLWFPLVDRMASIAGGTSSLTLGWSGLSAGGYSLPLGFLLMGILVLAALGRLIVSAGRSGVRPVGALLPTALDRLSRTGSGERMGGGSASPDLIGDSPAPVWWVSLSWMDRGVWGFGAVLGRLGVRFGNLLSRLEGRFYLTLALVLTLVALLVVTR
ncbi:MAG TPA: hypothetical protein VM409_07605 [Chloroflexia bacterium]|nr:hypothetical protein [Chloroflexia bacterium]